MQPALPSSSARALAQRPSPPLKSRVYVQLFSWFLLLIAVLHLFEGHSVGVYQLCVSLTGIYSSWDDVTSRAPLVCAFAAGCAVSVVLDVLYLTLLLCASSAALRDALTATVASNTFPNVAPALRQLLAALAADVHFFSLFSAVTSVLFDAMAAYWGLSLYRQAVYAAASSPQRAPLLRASPPPSYSPPR
ncbi:unnamed protein product, partial [Agarophyton chilense]